MEGWRPRDPSLWQDTPHLAAARTRGDMRPRGLAGQFCSHNAPQGPEPRGCGAAASVQAFLTADAQLLRGDKCPTEAVEPAQQATLGGEQGRLMRTDPTLYEMRKQKPHGQAGTGSYHGE